MLINEHRRSRRSGDDRVSFSGMADYNHADFVVSTIFLGIYSGINTRAGQTARAG